MDNSIAFTLKLQLHLNYIIVLFQNIAMSKTLVIILSETRTSELTFNNFKKNVIDELNADLCVCIGVKPNYNYDDPFYQLAKYKFLYDEPDDFGEAFDYAYKIISQDMPKYERLENYNGIYAKLKHPKQSTKNITYYGNCECIANIDSFDDDEIVIHTEHFPDRLWNNQVYGVSKSDNSVLVQQNHVVTYKKTIALA